MQTLTPLTALSVPPVITDSNGLVKNMSALEDLARLQLKAITILGMIYSLAAVGGKPNYKNNHAGAIQAGLTYMGGITNLDDVGISKQIWLILATLSWHGGAERAISSDRRFRWRLGAGRGAGNVASGWDVRTFRRF